VRKRRRRRSKTPNGFKQDVVDKQKRSTLATLIRRPTAASSTVPHHVQRLLLLPRERRHPARRIRFVLCFNPLEICLNSLQSALV